MTTSQTMARTALFLSCIYTSKIICSVLVAAALDVTKKKSALNSAASWTQIKQEWVHAIFLANPMN